MHRLDPRTKMIIVAFYLALLIMFDEIILQVILFLVLLPLIFAGHLLKNIMKSIRGMSFLFFFIILINTLIDSLNLGLQMTLRFVNILLAFSILFQTTNPDDMTQALTKIGIPYNISFSLSLAFRFIPTIAKETEIITDAQKSRGYDVEKGGILQQIKNLFPLIIPLVSNSIQRAYYVAESLEARSFGASGVTRTNIYPIKMKPADIIMIIFFTSLLILGIFLKIGLISTPSWLFLEIGL